VARNYTCRTGEIDLIARDGEDIAFVEVKFRSRSGYGTGAEHVTHTKQQRIVSAARHFLQYHKHAPSQVFRFDVFAIDDSPDGVQIEWIKSAFEAV
jgi:putative endonuclease